MSGAGKSQVLKFLEDLGYYCVDNLPVALIPTFAELALGADTTRPHVAVCVDARAGQDLRNLPGYLAQLGEMGHRAEVLFLDSADAVLQRRYSESRRRHPASPTGAVDEGIRNERQLLGPIRDRADLVLDTSAVSVPELRERIANVFLGPKEARTITITLVTFGYKYGLPPEADLVFDVRFLPNPHYDPELRPRTGTEPDVRDFVLHNDAAREFLRHLQSFLKFLVPRYAAEPRAYLTLAVGCTGGRHRSVVIAQELLRLLRDLGYEARVRHRDISRE